MVIGGWRSVSSACYPVAAQPRRHQPKEIRMDELVITVENLQEIHQRDAHISASDGATGDSGDTNDGG
jgi:hypothetical protein